MEDILNMCTESLKTLRDDYDTRIRRNQYIINSAEAKLERVEPLSDEFEETVKLIEDAGTELKQLCFERMQVHYEICNGEKKET